MIKYSLTEKIDTDIINFSPQFRLLKPFKPLQGDKFYLFFYYIDKFLGLKNSITFYNFEILLKKYIRLFINAEDANFYLSLYDTDYLYDLIINNNNFIKRINLYYFDDIKKPFIFS